MCNVIFLTISYMKYETETQVAFFMPKKFIPPKTSICFNMLTLLNQSSTNETGWFITGRNVYLLSNRTLGDLFSQLPLPSEVLSGCSYRNFTTGEHIKAENDTECTRIFNVKRFRMQTYVCYKFDINYSKPFAVHKAIFSVKNPGLLYAFVFKPPLNQGHAIKPMVHFDDLPNDERIFRSEIDTIVDENQLFYLSVTAYESTRLPSPYDTKCENLTRLDCVCMCSQKNFEKIGFIPIFTIHEDSPHLDHLRIPHSKNKTVLMLFRDIYKKCRS